ncbi:BnaAnng35770D [Brassica napus]|uniref:BnaAnng35770D protein n=1 Tax=Brassica napus TaxID=3708 RepID=A0A078JTV5_BRANA|nr:BnaAnng35770D [Brassica napus]
MSTSSSSDGASYVDMLYSVNDSNFGIPDRCPCGSAIIIQITTEAAAIPKKYFVCKDFKIHEMEKVLKKNAEEIALLKEIIEKL